MEKSVNRESLLIWGNFSPSDRPQALRRMLVLLTLGLGLTIGLGLALYAGVVYLSSDINRISAETREMNERNKELQVSLNRIRSFKNVEETVRNHPQVSHLQEAAEIIEVPRAALKPLPLPPGHEPRFPNAYGY